MSSKIIEMHHWTDSALGHYLLQWEQQRFDEAVVDIFGYHALQLGLPRLQSLRNNRMPHRWLALDDAEPTPDAKAGTLAQEPVAGMSEQASKTDHSLDFVPLEPSFRAAPEALPFAEGSLDLLTMPHTLEACCDPHAALREAARVLVPEGRLVISGLNPVSLLGLQRRVERSAEHLPDLGLGVGYWRLRDWLRLLGFEIEAVQFGCYRPATQSQAWLSRWRFMEGMGRRCWPVLGGVYCVVAVKRVPGMKLVHPHWRQSRLQAGLKAPAVSRTSLDTNWRNKERN